MDIKLSNVYRPPQCCIHFCFSGRRTSCATIKSIVKLSRFERDFGFMLQRAANMQPSPFSGNISRLGPCGRAKGDC